MSQCVFCELTNIEILNENEMAVAFFDKHPVNEGHVLIIPKRHLVSLFDATPEEVMSIWKLIEEVKEELDHRFHPDGYNIGVNMGGAAGQTIFHLHVHVIPRYYGDVQDPRGGIRKIKKSLVPYVGEGEE
ncbi:HIT family hydrolase, diadenosine tetraphosphate hydrolase [Desulfosporosinus orientis DSM 765]|uniref:HIT family hydrolase, diadenosine tetraphosphate hydrolase n=1 Tax=Desulfosporosinus orientis (strain ATCC 19365 / DSM 765 / NCIMB 8382 / VKM B-1628 / Singapore I) TaxID=768706 RepID=G7WHU9_DESOD|nr:HIT family protein [Desulfosporosinus orientis]AET69661.1 HIT family hydrolase, diadenosine tetraphosphate hydrolase [Desulfosporosinus orientis DSM 765]